MNKEIQKKNIEESQKKTDEQRKLIADKLAKGEDCGLNNQLVDKG